MAQQEKPQAQGEGAQRSIQPSEQGERRMAPRRSGYYSPFSLMRRMFEDFDSLLGAPGFAWSPQVEVLDRGKELCVRADLPGLSKDDVQIEFRDGVLTLQGERKQEKEGEEQGVWRSERMYGQFMRQLVLPENIDAAKANANFKDGVLEIVFPKTDQKERSTRIPIGEGQKQKQPMS